MVRVYQKAYGSHRNYEKSELHTTFQHGTGARKIISLEFHVQLNYLVKLKGSHLECTLSENKRYLFFESQRREGN